MVLHKIFYMEISVFKTKSIEFISTNEIKPTLDTISTLFQWKDDQNDIYILWQMVSANLSVEEKINSNDLLK
jgi:hypothetical protein